MASAIMSCYDYTMQYRIGDPRTISLEDRENYVAKLCDTLRFCHSDPQLYSFQVYKDDISRCYNQRIYNFDENILEQPNILNYINTLRDLEDAKIRRFDSHSLNSAQDPRYTICDATLSIIV